MLSVVKSIVTSTFYTKLCLISSYAIILSRLPHQYRYTRLSLSRTTQIKCLSTIPTNLGPIFHTIVHSLIPLISIYSEI